MERIFNGLKQIFNMKWLLLPLFLVCILLVSGCVQQEQSIDDKLDKTEEYLSRINNNLTEMMDPVTEAFNQIGSTFGTGFQMIHSPVGFASGVLEGDFSNDVDSPGLNKVASVLEIDYISQEEWSKLAQEGNLVPGSKRKSKISPGDAKLSLDTLEQPIREGTPIYIALQLSPLEADKNIAAANISMRLPPVLSSGLESCSTEPGNDDAKETGLLLWRAELGAEPVHNLTIYCYFDGFNITDNVKTYSIHGNAAYEFTS
jgi:hypothetical protein